MSSLLLPLRAPAPRGRRVGPAERRDRSPDLFARLFGAGNVVGRLLDRLLRRIELRRQLFQAMQQDVFV